MKERLMEILKKEGLSSAKFAEIIDVQRSSISHILSGRNKPSFDFVQKILLHFPSLSADWLITGEGDMYKKKGKDLFSNMQEDNAKTKKETNEKEKEKNNEIEKNYVQSKPNKEVTNVNNIKTVVILYGDYSFEEYSPR